MSSDTSATAASARALHLPAGGTLHRGRGSGLAPTPDSTDRRSFEGAYNAICRALLNGKLRPGTPLRERQLAEICGLTRGAVRKLLLRLSHEGKLEMFPNRGAFVPQPSRADIRQIYDSRKAVEAGLAALLATRVTPQQLSDLRAYVREEHRAQARGRRDESVKRAGGFHLEFARALGNAELTGIVQRLVSRTQMFVALYEPESDSGCAPDEHEAILEALTTRDSGCAAAAMVEHLNHVESRVVKHLDDEEPPQLADILRAAMVAELAGP